MTVTTVVPKPVLRSVCIDNDIYMDAEEHRVALPHLSTPTKEQIKRSRPGNEANRILSLLATGCGTYR